MRARTAVRGPTASLISFVLVAAALASAGSVSTRQIAAAVDRPPASLPPSATLPSVDAFPSPEWMRPPAGSRIAYVEGEDSQAPEIRSVTADGDDDSFVALGTLPSWSPDGERIAYTCKPDRIDAIGSVCVIDLRSGTSKVVVNEGTRARWSPAGDLIAFTRDVFGLGDAWIFRADPRATWPLPGALPEWSPTGRRLQVLTAEGRPEKPIIHVVRPDGSGERDLGEGWNATWSPDGRRIAATWWDGERTSVTAIDPRTGMREPLFEIDAPMLALRWLPEDGLVFVAERDGRSIGDLYVAELSTGAVRPLTSGIAVTPDLTVSPDGHWFAFTATVDGRSDIYVASRMGGWAPATSSGHATRPIWRQGVSIGDDTPSPMP